MQDMVHSTRDPYDNEVKTGVTTYASTSTGIDAFAASFDNPDGGDPVERLLTPLEALHIFRAQETTPTAAAARPTTSSGRHRWSQGKLSTEMVAAGALRGRPQVGSGASRRHDLTAPTPATRVSAMMDRPLTEYANIRLRQARRSKYSDQDLADLVKQLHDEERLVIGSTEKEEIKILCSIGVTAAMTDSLLDKADSEKFGDLFRLDLFWRSPDQPPIEIELDDGHKVTATNVSSYKGVRVWEVPALPGSAAEARLDQAIAKNSTNRLVIFHDGDKQVWRWPSRTTKGAGVISRPARHVHRVGSPDPKFAAKLDAIRLPNDVSRRCQRAPVARPWRLRRRD